ncbi:MAG: hypothetical protein HQL58_00085 [Magnetococcales bacterium]|nr:hypothetical protein [Magnetococcales bacterium]
MMNLTLEQHQALRQAADDFKKAMAIRNNFNIRIARRVTAILRVGMVSMGVVAIIFLLLLLVLTSKITYMIDVIDTMNYQFTSMAKDMATMRTVIVQMDQHVATLPVIVQEIGTMKGSVSSLHHNIDDIAARMKGIDDSLTTITYNVGNMTNTFRVMDGHVNGIGHDVQRMSRPMKLFNSMTPMR